MSLFYKGKHRRPPRYRLGRISLVVLLIALLSTSLALTLTRDRGRPPARGATSTPSQTAPTTPPARLPSRPDVYYIVFEEYGGTASLRDAFGYDNGAFLRDLEERGLYVAEDSTANYPRTLPSVASSLNMEYLQHFTQEYGTNFDGTELLEDMVDDHLVGRRLRARGYRWIHFGSWWKPTRESSEADRNVAYDADSPVPTELFGRPVTPAEDATGYRVAAYERILFQFDQLAKVSKERGPKFVFAHILSPHGPYVFDRQGDYRTRPEADSRGKEGAYVDQLIATNRLILGLVDTLLDRPAAKRPIVIIQADEGPYEGNPSHWPEFDPVLAVRKFPILNALYLPGVTQDLYSTITPVNIFRLVFDLYFGSQLPLLPDRNYTFRDTEHLFDLTDVTDRVQELVLAPPTQSPPSPTGPPATSASPSG